MKNKNVIRRLNKLAQSAEKSGYEGTAAECWYRANVLELVEDLLKEFKGIEKQMKYLWQTLDEVKEENGKRI